MMNSLSVGVSTAGSAVNSRSKFCVSRASRRRGLNGGCTSPRSRRAQSTRRKKACSRTSRAPAPAPALPSRLAGFFCSSCAASSASPARHAPSRATHALAQAHRLLAQRLGVGDVVLGDGREQLVLVLAVERRLAGQHLVEQHAERPPVHGAPVRLVEDDLRTHTLSRERHKRTRTHLGRDVVGRAAEGLGRRAVEHVLLAHAEVCAQNTYRPRSRGSRRATHRWSWCGRPRSASRCPASGRGRRCPGRAGRRGPRRSRPRRSCSRRYFNNPTTRGNRQSTHTATGSLKRPTCWIWNIRSPPFTNSMTK